MKQLSHKIMASFMAVVVLVTTTSFTINMHYCGDDLVDFSFVRQVKTCGMEKGQTTLGCQKLDAKKKSCCSDKQLVVEGQDDFKSTLSILNFEQQVFVASFVYSYLSLFQGIESLKVPFVDYPPPFLEKNVQVLHQTFLI